MGPLQGTRIPNRPSDLFLFSAPTHGRDLIDAFVRTSDLFALENTGFGIAGTGSLAANGISFVQGAVATGAGPTLIFNPVNSQVSWDADGTGAGAQQALATLTGILTMSENDFTIVGKPDHLSEATMK